MENAEKRMAELNHEEDDWKMAEVAYRRAAVRLLVASKETRR
jgi:hypothetical protein